MLRRTIGVSAALLGSDTTIHPIPGYELTALQGGDLANISAIILDQDDIDAGKVAEINEYGFGIPVFAAVKSTKDTTNLEGLHGVIALDDLQGDYFARQIAAAADKFEDEVLPVLRRAHEVLQPWLLAVRLPRPPGRPVLPPAPGRPSLLRLLRRRALPHRPL